LEEMGEYDVDNDFERGDFYIDMKEIKLINRISEGAFGVVFKGEWKSNMVAVKKMKVSDDESFIREVSILQSLRHPNILYLYGYSSNDSGDKFLITEYAVNGSLDKLLHNGNQSLKDFDQKMNVLCQIADTMAYLHGRSPRIVHRDLKPQNILLGENNHVRICDFGLSKITDSSFTMGRSYGTIEYCAPELLAHQGHDESVDIFSFGIIMHEMFILAPPYSQHEYSSVFTLGVDIVRGSRPPLQFDPFNSESNDSKVLVDFFLQSNTTNMLPSVIPLVVQDFYSLVTRCWDADISKRPSFEEITTELDAIKKKSA